MSHTPLDLSVKEVTSDEEAIESEHVIVKTEQGSPNPCISATSSPRSTTKGHILQVTPPDPSSGSQLRKRSLNEAWPIEYQTPDIYRSIPMQQWNNHNRTELSLSHPSNDFSKLQIPSSSVRVDDVTISLEDADLWRQFYASGTEMIINRAGRRMFPFVVITIKGLDPTTLYDLSLEVIPADNRRYKHLNNKWVPVGRADPQISNSPMVHQESPSTGAQWMSQRISFSKIKITNNLDSKDGNCILHSMHKYISKITLHERGGPKRSFLMDLTSFMAVTAYQNETITRMKIETNPFAKAFRDADTTALIRNAMNERVNPYEATLMQGYSPENDPIARKRMCVIGQGPTLAGYNARNYNICSTSIREGLRYMNNGFPPAPVSYTSHQMPVAPPFSDVSSHLAIPPPYFWNCAAMPKFPNTTNHVQARTLPFAVQAVNYSLHSTPNGIRLNSIPTEVAHNNLPHSASKSNNTEAE